MNELGLRSGDNSTNTENELNCKIANFLSIHRLCGEKQFLAYCKVRVAKFSDNVFVTNLTGRSSWHYIVITYHFT